MTRYLITKSLIESWAYCFNCYETAAEGAYRDFLATLRREPQETSEDAQNGIAFENDVYALVQDAPCVSNSEWEEGARRVANELAGARLQFRTERELSCCGMDFLVYGVLDGLRAGVIKDVKYSNTAFSSADLQGKYLNCSQHPCYFYLVPEAYRFDYLVSDGTDLYIESYTPQNSRPFPEIVEEFIRSITDMGLLGIYKEHWKTKESEN